MRRSVEAKLMLGLLVSACLGLGLTQAQTQTQTQAFARAVEMAAARVQGRVCETPDCMVVDQFFKSVSLLIYVPPEASSFTLGIFDQQDNVVTAKPSSFQLYAPTGQQVAVLGSPKALDWSEYRVDVEGRFGIWRLVVSAASPQPPFFTAHNYFRVRTIGNVDLYFRPRPAVKTALKFAPPKFGGSPIHRLFLQVPPDLPQFTLRVRRLRRAKTVPILLSPPLGQDRNAPSRAVHLTFEDKHRDAEEALVRTDGQSGMWVVEVPEAVDNYFISTDSDLRFFFRPDTSMPMPVPVAVYTYESVRLAPIPARIEFAAPKMGSEVNVDFSDEEGSARLWLLPSRYQVTARHGFEFHPKSYSIQVPENRILIHPSLSASQGQGKGSAPSSPVGFSFSVPLERAFARRFGWYCGDAHTHTIYSDGADTVEQMVAAAKAEGIDWICITDHGGSMSGVHIEACHMETVAHSVPGKFVAMPGQEITAAAFHANGINLRQYVPIPSGATLSQIIENTLAQDMPDHPVTIKLNHPHWEGAPQAAQLAEELDKLPLIEIWNSPEPQGTSLWWRLLNKGLRVFGETSTDSHDRKASPVGARRTYVYLGDESLSAGAVVRALRSGKSFLSRGALVYFSLNGLMPGDEAEVRVNEGLTVEVAVDSQTSLERIDLVCNGEVIQKVACEGKSSFQTRMELDGKPGWYLVQVYAQGQAIPVAMTNPVFVRRR